MAWNIFKRGKPDIFRPRLMVFRSIANKLAVLHILTVVILFSVISVLLYLKLSNYLYHTEILEFQEATTHIRTLLRAPNGLELLKGELQTQIYEGNHLKFLIRIIDHNNRTIAESPNMSRYLPVSSFSVNRNSSGVLKLQALNGDMYLVKYDNIPDNGDIFQGGQVQLARNMADVEGVATFMRNSFTLFSMGGAVFAFLSALVIIRLTLKPLNDMSAVVQQITDSRLDSRIDLNKFPVEMQLIASAFNNMMERLESSFSKLAQYSENMAHELRTPLNNLMVEADIILSQERSLEEYQAVISSSMEEYEHLSLLINRLLFLARAENHTVQLTIEKLDVRLELENIAEYYSEMAHDKNITITVSGQAILMADDVLLTRAIGNLLSNAINYSSEGGCVTLDARQCHDDSAEIAVRDTGRGIDEGILPKIFDRYFWVDSSRKKDPKGVGLGLDIVKAIMNLHGGSISVESELGKGTSATLKFPPIQLISTAQSALR